MLNVNELIGFATMPVNNIYIVDSVTSTSSTIVIPSRVLPKQLLVLFDSAVQSGAPGSVIPSGFTSAVNTNSTNWRNIVSYKISDDLDNGRTLTGMNGGLGNNKILVALSFEYGTPINSVTLNSAIGEQTAGAPANQIKTVSAEVKPVVIIGAFYGDGTVAGSLSPSEDFSISRGLAHQLKGKSFGASPINTTVSQNDAGAINIMQSLYFTVN